MTNMNPVTNFDHIMTQHEMNETRVAGAAEGFSSLFNQIPFVNLVALYLKNKFEKTKDIHAINVKDTANTIVRLSNHKKLPITQAKAEKIVTDSIALYNKSPGAKLGYILNGGLVGAIVGGLGGGIAGSEVSVEGGIAGAVIGGLAGAVGGGYIGNLIGKAKTLTHPDYKREVLTHLRKLAEEKKRLQYSDYDPHFTQNITAAVAGIGGTAASQVAGEMLRKELNKPGVTTKRTVRRFMKDNKDIHVTFSPHKANKGMDETAKFFTGTIKKDRGNPYYAPLRAFGGKKNFINSPVRNLDVAMHELGHAKDFKNSNAFKLLAPKLAAPIAGSYLTYKALQNEDTVKYAPAGALLGMAPTLLAEAQANRHAYNALRKYQGGKAANKFLKTIVAKNTGSYWSIPLALGAGSYVAGKLMHKNIKHEESKGKRIPFRDSISSLRKMIGE